MRRTVSGPSHLQSCDLQLPNEKVSCNSLHSAFVYTPDTKGSHPVSAKIRSYKNNTVLKDPFFFLPWNDVMLRFTTCHESFHMAPWAICNLLLPTHPISIISSMAQFSPVSFSHTGLCIAGPSAYHPVPQTPTQPSPSKLCSNVTLPMRPAPTSLPMMIFLHPLIQLFNL